MKSAAFLVLSLSLVLACGDDVSSGGGGAGASGGAGGEASGGSPTTGGGGQGGEGGAGGSGGATGGAGGGAACIDASGFDYGEGPNGEPGCLTFASANTFCGFGSDGAICDFSVSCGLSPDVGQCEINCEQGSSSFCNEAADVDCVIAAYCADDCVALMQCEFIL